MKIRFDILAAGIFILSLVKTFIVAKIARIKREKSDKTYLHIFE